MTNFATFQPIQIPGYAGYTPGDPLTNNQFQNPASRPFGPATRQPQFGLGDPNNLSAFGGSISTQENFGNIPSVPPTYDPSQMTFGLFDQFDKNKNKTQQGLLNPVLSGIGSVFNIYEGLKQLGIQRDSLNFQKSAFNRNFAASKASFKNQLDQQFGSSATLRSNGNTAADRQAYIDSRSNF